MKSKYRIATLIVTVLVLQFACSSCTKHLVPWTSNIKTQFKDLDERDIQFYLMGEIRLEQDSSKAELTITPKGKIQIKEEKKKDQVIILDQTPGICTSIEDNGNLLTIAFEKDDTYTLNFIQNPSLEYKFTLAGQNWKGKVGKVTYNGDSYFTQSATAYLAVDIRKLAKSFHSERVAHGRKVKKR